MFKCEGSVKKFVFEFVVSIVAVIFILLFFSLGDTIQHNYKQQCGVYEVHDTYTTFIDPVGYLWDYETTEYKEGESVMIYFFDNFTDFDREDDEITKIKRVD